MSISISLAFLAGLASFLSPCVLSLVPAYIGYLSGRSISEINRGTIHNKGITFIHGLFFILGFSFVFIVLGLVASSFGSILFEVKGWISRIGGIVVIIFGLHLTGLIKIKYFEYDLRPQNKKYSRRSLLSSMLMGVFFSAGWSPCVGPVLGAILTLALSSGSIMLGAILLTAYSMGLAIPFMLASIGIGWVNSYILNYRSILRYLEFVMGSILIIIGFLLFLGVLEQLSRFGTLIDFGM